MSVIELGGAVVTAAGNDPDRFTYAPKAPGIARDAHGRRQLNVLRAGAVAFLQVTGAWGLSAAEVDRMRTELAARLGRDPAALDLTPAADAVEGVVLLLADAQGELQVLQAGKSSGVPPFHAAFNVMLSEDQLKQVEAALGGERDRLVLRYDIARRLPVTVEGRVETRVREAAQGQEGGRAWSGSREEAATRTTRERAGQVTRFSVQADAADWSAGR